MKQNGLKPRHDEKFRLTLYCTKSLKGYKKVIPVIIKAVY